MLGPYRLNLEIRYLGLNPPMSFGIQILFHAIIGSPFSMLSLFQKNSLPHLSKYLIVFGCNLKYFVRNVTELELLYLV